jgi:hypothetical protein
VSLAKFRSISKGNAAPSKVLGEPPPPKPKEKEDGNKKV